MKFGKTLLVDLASDSEPDDDPESSELYGKPGIVKLSDYNHKVHMASITGHALQALQEFWSFKDPGGFDTVSRITDI